MLIKGDLHNHSCVSPCADLEMSPSDMARRARELGIGILALTDHNTALNTPAFEHHCLKEGILPIFGMEINSQEEAHVLCLFETKEQALTLGKEIYPLLPQVTNIPEKFGDQVFVDSQDMIAGEVEIHLGGAVSWSLDSIRDRVLADGGLFIPAHIDRPMFSLSSQLGFVPDDFYHALEVIHLPTALATYQNGLIQNSDAHLLESMGRRTTQYEMDAPSFQGLKQALEKRHFTC